MNSGKPWDKEEDRTGSAEVHADEMDQKLEEALSSFRLSVHAWSEAAYSSPREVAAWKPRARSWKVAASWALSAALIAGVAAGSVKEVQHRHEVTRIAAQREADRQQQVAEERAREAEDLLAKVDRDVSQEVPDAMEPLAQMMTDDESR